VPVNISRLARVWLVVHAVDLGYLDDEDVAARTDCRSVRVRNVTGVLGMNCQPCVQNTVLPILSKDTNHLRSTQMMRSRDQDSFESGDWLAITSEEMLDNAASMSS
jgi:hypothetical protein